MGQMKHIARRHGWIGALATLALVALPAHGGPPSSGSGATTVGREELRLDFGDFTSRAELTYPAGAAGKSPAVILIPGGSPVDMNGDTLSPYDGPFFSHDYRTIADDLPRWGFAALRYNKHYVTSLRQVDYGAYFAKITLQRLLADAEQAVKAAKADPHVDPRRIYVLGWSEGSTVAAALAARHPELAGLILTGTVALSWRATFLYQVEGVGLPYLRSVAPDGRVTQATIARIEGGAAGFGAKTILNWIGIPGKAPNTYTLNRALDRNHDGAIEIDTELAPLVPALVDYVLHSKGEAGRIYGPGHALPTVAQQASVLKMPVLLLQGTNDASAPPAGVRTLDAALGAAGNTDHTLKLYAGLGHSLGPARDTADDLMRPISRQPLDDLAQWLSAHR